MPPVGAWFAAFLITLTVEAPIVLALTRAADMEIARRFGIIVFAQLATHPLVWFVFPRIVGLRGSTALSLSELWAFVGEATLYALAFRGVTVTRAAAASALANGGSLLAGVALARLGFTLG
jgi:hypothetical protein